MERIVTIRSTKSKYKKHPFNTPVVFSTDINTYLTGQHIDPRDESTKNNLTANKMLGKEPLTELEKERFPFVLNPDMERIYGIVDGTNYNLTLDEKGKPIFPEQYVMANWMMKYVPEVAKNSSSVIPDKHFFYIEDRYEEAVANVSKKDKIFDAMSIIRKMAVEQLRDLALLLNYYVKSFHVNVNLSETLLKEQLYTQCETTPDFVLKFKEKGVQDDLYFLKLAYHGIIQYREGAYYDGSKFLGTTLTDLKTFVSTKENSDIAAKWNRTLSSKIGDTRYVVPTKDSETSNVGRTYDTQVNEFYKFVEEKNYDESLKKYRSAIAMNRDGVKNAEMKEALEKLKLELEEIEKQKNKIE